MSQGQLYQIQDCTNCKQDCWRLGPRLGPRSEYACFYCGAVIEALTPREDA